MESCKSNGSVKFALALVLAGLLVALAGASPVFPQSAYAAEAQLAPAAYGAGTMSWGLSKSSITLKRYNTDTSVYLTGSDLDSYWSYDVYSSNSSVASVSSMMNGPNAPYFTIQKEGVGKATIYVEDWDGNTRQIAVTCKPTDFKLYSNSFTFSKKNKWSSYWYPSVKYEDDHAGDSVIKKAKSSKSKVASAKVIKSNGYSYVRITPKKAGKAKIKLTDQYGRTKTVKVKVKKNYFKANLKAVTSAYAYYGSKQASVYTREKAKVSLRIGGKTYKKRADKNGVATIKLKKIFKKGVKFSVTAKTKRAKAKIKTKVGSNSYCWFNGSISSCRTTVPVRVSNVHKGDVLVIKAGKEKHKIKFHSDFSSFSTSFFMNYNLSNYYYLTLTLKNKYGQKLDKSTWQISW